MIHEDKKYIIDGWVVYILTDILKYLKRQLELNEKKYSKDEFVSLYVTYNDIIKYLLNLNTNKTKDNIYSKDDFKDLEKLLKSMKITLTRNSKNKK